MEDQYCFHQENKAKGELIWTLIVTESKFPKSQRNSTGNLGFIVSPTILKFTNHNHSNYIT